MSDLDSALVLRLEASLSKFEKQMTRARKVGTSSTLAIQKQFDTSHKRMAATAEQSANAIGREMDRLRAKYDPVFRSSKKYEAALSELNRAHKVGAINAGQYDRALDSLNQDYARASAGVSGLSGTTRGLKTIMGGAQHQIQNAAFQVGDFAVQVGSGQRASTALAQQLPQLLGSFGALGAVMGAVVAIGVPLAAYFLRNGDGAEELGTKLEALEVAVSDYSSAVQNAKISTADLEEKYGSASEAATVFLGALSEINEASSLDALDSALDDISGKFGRALDPEKYEGIIPDTSRWKQEYDEVITNISEQLSITRIEAEGVASALNDLAMAQGVDAQVDAMSAFQILLKDTIGSSVDLSTEMRLWVKESLELGQQAAETLGLVESTSNSMADIVSGISSAVGGMDGLVSSADTLAAKMFTAAGAAWDYAGALGEANRLKVLGIETSGLVGGGRGGDPRRFGDAGKDRGRFVYTSPKRAGRGGRGGSSGRRGKPDKPFFEDAEAQIIQLERQIEMIGKSSQEIAKMTAKYKLLDEAKKRGLDLDAKQSASGKTLREDIDAQAQAIGNLTTKVDEYREKAQFMDGLNQDLQDGFIDAIIEGENFGDVLENVAKQLAKAALQAALFGTGPFSSGGSGGGLLGGLFSSLFNADGNVFSGDKHVQAYANGGVVNRPTSFSMNGNKTGIMGEAGPEAILPLARIGGKLGVQTTGGGGSSMDVRVFVDQDGNWQAAVENIAGPVSAKVTQAGLEHYSKHAAPTIQGQIANDPRRIG